MSRLTLRLPATLHQQLTHLAASEGVSLNQYIVYALTRQTALVHSLRNIPSVELEEEQQKFQLLLQQLGQPTSPEIESILATREPIEPEAELSSDVITRLKAKIRRRS